MLIFVNLKVLPNNTYEIHDIQLFWMRIRDFQIFREFVQNSRNSRKLIFAKINPLKVVRIAERKELSTNVH